MAGKVYKPRPKEQRHQSYLCWYAKHKTKHLVHAKEYAAANREKILEQHRQYYQANKERSYKYSQAWILANPKRRQTIVKRYYDTHQVAQRVSNRRAKAKRAGYACNLDAAVIEAAMIVQQGKCAICGEDGGSFIDHCHVSGFFRGLLCNECNLMLGKAKDDPARLRRAADYLERASISEEELNEQSALAETA